MTDRPILMSAPMVRALLDGRKTQTRRLAWRASKAKRLPEVPRNVTWSVPTIWQKVKPGDRLWVRETWRHTAEGVWTVQSARNAYGGKVEFKADHPDDWHGGFPSIHMPREFSRITLLVTATKMERVQEISEADAIAEGMVLSKTMSPLDAGVHRQCFIWLWNELRGKGPADYTPWKDNPEVVALTFQPVLANIDQVPS